MRKLTLLVIDDEQAASLVSRWLARRFSSSTGSFFLRTTRSSSRIRSTG
jgi:hypothetical protein